AKAEAVQQPSTIRAKTCVMRVIGYRFPSDKIETRREGNPCFANCAVSAKDVKLESFDCERISIVEAQCRLLTTEYPCLRAAARSRSVAVRCKFPTIPSSLTLKATARAAISGRLRSECLTAPWNALMAASERSAGLKSLPERRPSPSLVTGCRSRRLKPFAISTLPSKDR